MNWKTILPSFAAALLFGMGLGASGMTTPDKIIGFLDLFGNWDPSMLFVMAGAVVTHGLTYRMIKKRSRPILEDKFRIPTSKLVDWRLIIGASIFGIGWGLAGFCPGPAIVALSSGKPAVIIFVVSMCIGILIYRKADNYLRKFKEI